jgi:hypothetical protein
MSKGAHRPRQTGLRHISDILTDILQAEQPEQQPRVVSHPFNRHCPCPECMRAYLRSVETRRGDAA